MDYYGNNDFRDYQKKTNDYLAHFGILGMKWGIRRFQPYSVHPRKGGEGGKEVGEAKRSQEQLVRDISRDAKYWRTIDGNKLVARFGQKTIAEYPEIQEAHQKLVSARAKYRDSCKLAEEYNNLPGKDRDKYIRMASDAAAERQGYTSKEDKDRLFEWYKYDDGDQGEGNSFGYYCKEKGTTYSQQLQSEHKAYDEYKKETKKAAKSLLGVYGDTKLSGRRDDGKYDTAVDAVDIALHDLLDEERFRKKYYMPV